MWLRKCLAVLLGDANFAEHVASLAVDHNNAQISIFIDEVVLVGDDVGMPQLLQQLQLVLNILLLTVGTVDKPQLLDHVIRLLLLLMPAKKHLSERSGLGRWYPTPIDLPI